MQSSFMEIRKKLTNDKKSIYFTTIEIEQNLILTHRNIDFLIAPFIRLEKKLAFTHSYVCSN
ncbi:hypothetical protein SAMN06265220_101927 [Flavobacterium nitrogenifigens]|uniref:Uncharacterized protein n=1 Tax=Flavobacterium nitrogenifigens TaxID=1617283 RepID=A0A521BEA4_9FLAO|nr:hypothetical protein SAMN06265220_101927 [Flavobacterium nitrogenifigens]